MSERLRRSTRLQDKRTKRTKLAAKFRKKSCRIADDDSSSDNSTDDNNDLNNTSFTIRKQQIGSRGGNFTRVYNSYNKETSQAATLDVYENDFIDDGDDSYYSDSTEEDEVINKGENSYSDQSMEEESQLHTSFSSRKRKRRLNGDSSSEESSNSDVVTRKKKRPALKRSSRAASLKEKKEADKMEKLQELKRTRERKRAGLRIEALEEEQKEDKDDSTNEQATTESEEDDKFVVSDDEIGDQPSDFEHSTDDLHLTLKPSMSTHLFSPDHISEVKKQFLKTFKRRKSIDCDELFEIMEEGDFKKIDAFMEQLMNFYNNPDLNSDVAHLVLQLAICYNHSTLVEPLIQQYKIDTNRPDHRGIFPLTLAAAYGHCDCFKILLYHTKLQSILAQHPTLLHVAMEAALSNQTDDDSSYHIMKMLFEERREFFDQMMSSKTHPTVVEMVIWYGRLMCLAFLLEHCSEVFEGVEIAKSTAEEFPPSLIILAVCSPHQQEIGNNLILQLLLEHEIGDINMSNTKGWTGLMWSTYYRNTDCMRTLLDHYATVYCRDEHGTSCLHIAALLGATECAQLLINHHHPVDCPDNKGWPPLLYANFSSERECVLTIMKAKPNQLLMLGNLLEKSCDVESEAKQRTYLQVQKVLEAVAQHEAYYALFNQFVCDNPDILMEDGDSTFLQKCKDLLDFNNKKKWFYKMLENLKKNYRGDYYGCTAIHGINRESVMLTAYRKLKCTSASSLRMHFSVTFHNEPGVAAGPRREFWSCFSQDVIKKDHHMFKECDNSHYTFVANEILKNEKHHKCSIGHIKENNLDLLKFIGKMLAVAVNHKDIISFRLVHPILKMLLGMSLVHPDDMEATDGEYYQNFQSFDGDISDLGLSFSDLLCCSMCRKHEKFDLPNNNDQNDVNESNKAAFIKAVSVFKLVNSIEKETESFLKGFWEVIPVRYLRIFNPDQFSLLLSGIPTIDVDDWEQNTEYTYYGSSSEDSAKVIIDWFWSLVRSLAEEEKALLLKFCTGSPRVPAGGFANLEGLTGLTKFRISFASGEDRVPEASTCFNNLRLSHYTNEQQCRDKILIAIRFGCEGFSFG